MPFDTFLYVHLVNNYTVKFSGTCRDEHSASVLLSIQTIMVLLIEESDEILEDLLLIALSVLGRYESVKDLFLP